MLDAKQRLINEMEMVRKLLDIPKTVRSISKEQRTLENSERYTKTLPNETWIPWAVWKTRQLKDEIKNEYKEKINNDISIFDQYFES